MSYYKVYRVYIQSLVKKANFELIKLYKKHKNRTNNWFNFRERLSYFEVLMKVELLLIKVVIRLTTHFQNLSFLNVKINFFGIELPLLFINNFIKIYEILKIIFTFF